jgi:hypothetical protein
MSGSMITREQLALLLENEAHSVIAEHIRAGTDPVHELGDGRGGLRKALRSSRYADSISRNARGTFAGIVRGEIKVIDS